MDSRSGTGYNYDPPNCALQWALTGKNPSCESASGITVILPKREVRKEPLLQSSFQGGRWKHELE